MHKRSIIEALRTLQAQEVEAFDRLVRSPYFVSRTEVVALWDYLRPHWPHFVGEALAAEAAHTAVWPAQPFDEKKLRYLLSDLNRVLEDFWVLELNRAHPRQNHLKLLGILGERQLEKAYRKIDKVLAADLNLDTPTVHDATFFQDRLTWLHHTERRFERQRQRRFDPTIQYTADCLDHYYYLERLKLACAMLDRQTILQGAYQHGITEAWLTHLQQSPVFDEPVIQLFYRVLRMLLAEEDETAFAQLTQILNQPHAHISPLDLRDGYRPAINYCARKIRLGREDFVAEALALYQQGIAKGLLLENGELSPWTFTNIVKLMLRQQRYPEIEDFIHRHAPLLPEAFRHNALHYNLAELYYYTHRIREAQENLTQVAWSDLNYYLGARVMLAKIYYENHEEEALLSLLAAFTIFLKRNKELSAELKLTYLHFCEILFQLLRRNPKKIGQLGARIRETTLLTDRNWLWQQWELAT